MKSVRFQVALLVPLYLSSQAALVVSQSNLLLSRHARNASAIVSSLEGRIGEVSDLMEHAILDAVTNVPSDSAANSSHVLHQIGRDFPRLRKMWTRLFAQRASEVAALENEIKRAGAARAAAERLAELREKDHAHVQSIIEAEMSAAHQCGEELKRAREQPCANSVSNSSMRQGSDLKRLDMLVKENAQLRMTINGMNQSLVARAAEVENLQKRWQRIDNASLANAEDKIALAEKDLQNRSQQLSEEIKQFSKKEADMKEKEENAEDDRDAMVEMNQQLHATNDKLQADNAAQAKLIAQLQKEIEVLSKDKHQLLDGFRSMLHGQASPASLSTEAPPHVIEDSASLKMSHPSEKMHNDIHKLAEDVAWMDKTAKIDKYLYEVHAYEAPVATNAVAASPAGEHAPKIIDADSKVAESMLDQFLAKNEPFTNLGAETAQVPATKATVTKTASHVASFRGSSKSAVHLHGLSRKIVAAAEVSHGQKHLATPLRGGSDLEEATRLLDTLDK